MNKDIFTHIEVWIIILIALVLGFFIGTTFKPFDYNAASVDKNNAESMETRKETAKKEPITTKLDGSGQQSTKEIALQAGKVHIHSINKGGDTNFSVYLIDNKGKEVVLLANELGGDSDTSKDINIAEGGNYTFNVSGNGNWTIEITQ